MIEAVSDWRIKDRIKCISFDTTNIVLHWDGTVMEDLTEDQKVYRPPIIEKCKISRTLGYSMQMHASTSDLHLLKHETA